MIERPITEQLFKDMFQADFERANSIFLADLAAFEKLSTTDRPPIVRAAAKHIVNGVVQVTPQEGTTT